MASTLNFNAFFNSFSTSLDAPLRQHLKNVYGCLSLATVSAAVGAYVHMFTHVLQANLLTTLCTLSFLTALMTTPDDGKNQSQRLSYVVGFAFLSGLGLGPLLELVVSVDPRIVITALVGTSVVFVSFSISALLAPRGRWLFLGGTLMSILNTMIVFSLVNLFLRSTIIYQAHLYVGLFVVCGFVIYDTQLIVEKFHLGNRDFVMHSLDLFIDFIGIFRHLLVILTQKEVSKDSRKRRD